MKILFFYQYFGTPEGGWSTRVYELTRRWVEAGHEVTVVTAPYDKSDIKADGFISRQEVAGIKLIVVNSGDSNRLPVLKRVLRAIIFALVSCFYALRLKCDIVIASSGPITIGLPMILAKTFRRKKTVFEVRDLWPSGGVELGLIKSAWQKKLAFWFEALCYKKSDLIVPCSPGMEASILERFPASQTLVIPNASDIEVFQIERTMPDYIPEGVKGTHIFLYAGSLGLMDDCQQIIDKMNLLTSEPISLVFIGDGAERQMLEKQAKETGNPNIYFLGLIPKTEVAKWFSIATASFVTFKDYRVLHTSSPNKMFDSFAAGVPVIQSTKGWIKALIEKEQCGINVDAHKTETFPEAMKLLVGNESLKQQLAHNARQVALTLFNRSLLSQRYLESLEQLNQGRV